VLAIPLLNANRVVSIDRLADDLYGDATPASAVTQMQGHISQLRKLLDPGRVAGAPGSLLETREPGYLIRVAPEQIDLHRFERWTRDALESLSQATPRPRRPPFGVLLSRGAARLWPISPTSPSRPLRSQGWRKLRLAALEHRI
jgi:hypothetical protein